MIRVVFRLSVGSKGILNVDREGEDSILGDVFPADCLDHVQTGTALVDRRKGNYFFVQIIRVVIELIVRRSFGKRVLLVDLDEHYRLRAVFGADQHRVDDRYVEFPIERDAGLAGMLHEREIVALGALQRLAVLAHDTNGNINGILPLGRFHRSIIIFIVSEYDLVNFFAVARHPKSDRRLITRIELIIPLFCDRNLLDSGALHRVRIRELRRAFFSRTCINIREGRSRIGLKAAVYVDVFLNLRIEFAPCAILAGIVHDVGNIVEGGLARINIKRHGVGNAVQQRSHVRKIPINSAVFKLCCGRIKVIEIRSFFPLDLDDIARNSAGIRRSAALPGDRHSVTAGRNSVFPFRAADEHRDLVAAGRHLPSQPVLIRILIHVQQVGDFTGRCGNRAGGAVTHGCLSDTGCRSDGCGNRGKCVVNFLFTVGGIIETVRRAIAGGHQVLHVGLAGIGTVSKNTVQVVLIGIKLCSFIIRCIKVSIRSGAATSVKSVVVGMVIGGGCAAVVVGGLAVGEEHHKGFVSIGFGVRLPLGVIETTVPVGAASSHRVGYQALQRGAAGAAGPSRVGCRGGADIIRSRRECNEGNLYHIRDRPRILFQKSVDQVIDRSFGYIQSCRVIGKVVPITSVLLVLDNATIRDV